LRSIRANASHINSQGRKIIVSMAAMINVAQQKSVATHALRHDGLSGAMAPIVRIREDAEKMKRQPNAITTTLWVSMLAPRKQPASYHGSALAIAIGSTVGQW
jgi:hypothetical protein